MPREAESVLGGKKVIISALALTAVLILGGCSFYGSTPNNSSNQTTTTAPDTINIQNFSFSPATLTVKKGATVTWTNNDSAPHQIKSASFNSSQFGKGQNFTFTFNDAGTFDYSCAIHPSMKGMITVE